VTRVCDRMTAPEGPAIKGWCSEPITNYTCYYDNQGNGTPF
jgi:hypothetical protein